jgi:hypothetical protein
MFEVLKSRSGSQRPASRTTTEIQVLSNRDLSDFEIHRSSVTPITRIARSIKSIARLY